MVIFLCDEFLDLSAELKKGSDSPLGRLLYKGRAAGYVTWGLSQVPTADTLGPLRKMFQQRVAFRLDSATSCRPALSVDAPAHLLDRPGVGYLHREGMAAPVKFRAPLVTDAETGMIARGTVPYMPGDEVVDPHVVYRFWGVVPGQEDDGEQLLYVGLTNDFDRRDEEHKDRSPWRGFVTRYEADEEWPNRARAAAAEARAIEEERPLFNKQGNGRNPLRVVASWGRAA